MKLLLFFCILLIIYTDEILLLNSSPGTVTCCYWDLHRSSSKMQWQKLFCFFFSFCLLYKWNKLWENPRDVIKAALLGLLFGLSSAHLSEWAVITQTRKTRTFLSKNQITCFSLQHMGIFLLESAVSQVNSCCWALLWISDDNSDRVSLRRQLNYFASRAGLFCFFLSWCHSWIYFSCFRVFGGRTSCDSLTKVLLRRL